MNDNCATTHVARSAMFSTYQKTGRDINLDSNTQMKYLTRILILLHLTTISVCAEELPAGFIKGSEERRERISLGGNFRPSPNAPVFVAVGHGGRILMSRDDGKSWSQVHWGYPGSDHGLWATKAIAYTGGVFVVPIGWGAATAWLASEDGETWRHLTSGKTQLTGIKDADGDPSVMPGTWGIAGGKGVFVTGGYMMMGATPDFGKTITTFALHKFKQNPRSRKLVTHHVGPVYCGDTSGRFLALGNDRSKENPVFGNLYASDDLGQSWIWLEPMLLNEKCNGYSGIVSNGETVLIADKEAATVFISANAGDTWEGPFPTGTAGASLSMVGTEFWLLGRKVARASLDGKTWYDLPKGIPTGKIVASPDGTLISIDRRRCNILRSTDSGETWGEVHRFQPETENVHGAQGLRDIVFGYTANKR
jgi:hypothetical protein